MPEMRPLAKWTCGGDGACLAWRGRCRSAEEDDDGVCLCETEVRRDALRAALAGRRRGPRELKRARPGQ